MRSDHGNIQSNPVCFCIISLCVFVSPLHKIYNCTQNMSFRTLALPRIPSGGRTGKTRYVCQLCARTLDDCLFADEVTKKITPFCKSCRSILQERKTVDINDKDPSATALSRGQNTSPIGVSQIQTSSSSTELPVISDGMLNDLIQAYAIKERKRKQRCMELSVGVVPSPNWVLQWNGAEFQSSLYIATVLYHRCLVNTN